MCKVTEIEVDGKKVRIADIKQIYIPNIVDAAKKCKYIDRIILFGSSLEERCSDESDIDLAIFGNQPEGKCLLSKQYRDFARQISSFHDYEQTHDFLYFKTGRKYDGPIMDEIAKGQTIYARE